MANETVDSNRVGLKWAEEETLKTLPESPVWRTLDPNSYGAFGGNLKTMARTPINASRQREKGTVVGLEAAGSFEQDLTQDNLLRLMQGFCFADAHEKPTTAPLNSAAIDLGAVVGSAHTIAAASGLGSFLANHLVLTSGFAVSANNGLFTVASATATLLTLSSGLSDESNAPAAAKVQAVGYEFGSATVDIEIASGLARIVRKSGTVDFTTLGLSAGEIIYVGGDAAGTSFTNNKGWARVGAIAADYIEFDKTRWTPEAEVGTGKTVRIFFGTLVKNENDPDSIKRRSYTFEQTLGADADGTMAEALKGTILNELTIKVPSENKVTMSLGLVACDWEPRTGSDGPLSATGTPIALASEEAFNTTSDVSVKLALTSSSTALAAYANDLEVSIKNTASQVPALGVLGGIDVACGNFEAGGKATLYFKTQDAAKAVKANSDVTFDVILAKKNAGLAIDLPLVGLGGGAKKIEPNRPITMDVENTAYKSKFGHTLAFHHFAYLPTAAC